MEISEVKEWLKRGWKINKEMARLESSVTNLRSRASYVSRGGYYPAVSRENALTLGYMQARSRNG